MRFPFFTARLGASLLSFAVLLSACSALPPPQTIANVTVADEKGSLAIEVAYRAVGALIEAAVKSGELRGDAALQVDAIDAEIAHWVEVARAAYDVGNSVDYSTAVDRATALSGEVRFLLKARGGAGR